VLSFAPHGGKIQKYTDKQAFLLARHLAGCPAWAFCGYANDGAYDEHHERSSHIEIRDDRHRHLSKLNEADFRTAVSFHGFNPDSDVDVYLGGNMDHSDRDRVKDHVVARTDDDVQVEVTQRGDGLHRIYGGIRSENIVNRLAEKVLQLEQTMGARRQHREDICRGVADAFEEILR